MEKGSQSEPKIDAKIIQKWFWAAKGGTNVDLEYFLNRFWNQSNFKRFFEHVKWSPGVFYNRRAGSQEGGRGGGKPPPWGSEVWKSGFKDWKKKAKQERKKDLHARPVGRRIDSGPSFYFYS